MSFGQIYAVRLVKDAGKSVKARFSDLKCSERQPKRMLRKSKIERPNATNCQYATAENLLETKSQTVFYTIWDLFFGFWILELKYSVAV
jgi:hypothetical protein